MQQLVTLKLLLTFLSYISSFSPDRRIGLRYIGISGAPQWIYCKDRCRLRGCLGYDLSRYNICQPSVLMLEKIRGAGSVAVGENLVLRSFYFQAKLISCKPPRGVCKPTSSCGLLGSFDSIGCSAQQLQIFVPGKSAGDTVTHGDTVVLRYTEKNKGRISWIGCNLANNGTQKCKRRSDCPSGTAPPHSCPFETFQIFSL